MNIILVLDYSIDDIVYACIWTLKFSKLHSLLILKKVKIGMLTILITS